MSDLKNSHPDSKEKTVSLTELSPFISSLLTEGKSFYFHPYGKSMEPFFHSGREKVEIIRLPFEDYRKMDVLLYQRETGNFVLHRIVGKNEEGFILCGDAQFSKEYGIKEDKIFGYVRGFYRGKRWIDCRKNWKYRFFSSLWVNLFFIRKAIFYLKHPIRLSRGILKKIKYWG